MNEQRSLTASLNSFIENWLVQVHTAIPCRVLAIAPQESRVDVQPLISLVDGYGGVSERATILGVPLITPASKTSVINIPIQKGDIVLCIFSMRGLDAFKAGDGTPEAPTDFRMFDKRDAMAIPGLFPFGMHPNAERELPYNPDALSLANDIGLPSESLVELSSTGITLQTDASKVEVTADGVNITGTLTINGVPYLNHTHTGVASGTATSGSVAV